MAEVHRVPNARIGDMRSNITAGGHPQQVEITDDMLRIAETVRPKLVEDGIFLAGLDIVGDKLMEINVLTAASVEKTTKRNGPNDFSTCLKGFSFYRVVAFLRVLARKKSNPV